MTSVKGICFQGERAITVTNTHSHTQTHTKVCEVSNNSRLSPVMLQDRIASGLKVAIPSPLLSLSTCVNKCENESSIMNTFTDVATFPIS